MINIKRDNTVLPIALDNDFIENPVWDFVEAETGYFIKNSSRLFFNNKTSDIHFVASMKRGPLYYMINNVYPCLILNVVTLLTFFLPFSLQASLSN